MALPNAEYTDTLSYVHMFAAGVPSDVTSEASIVDRRAVGTLTLAAVVAGDTAVVNGKTYTAVTFTANPTNQGMLAPRSFAVGASDTITTANLAAAINSFDGNTVIATAAAAVLTVKAVALGTSGNAIALGATTHFTRSAATLAGGTATNAIALSTTNSTGNKLVVAWMKKPAAAV